MKTFERTAVAAAVATALAGCHETLTQLEPQSISPAVGGALGFPDPLPGLADLVAGDTVAGDTIEITPAMIALRLIATAEEVLATTGGASEPGDDGDAGSAGDGRYGDRLGGSGARERDGADARNRERARELIRWARAALASGDHARSIRRGYYACRLLGALPR